MNNQELRDKLTSYHALPKIKVNGAYIPVPKPVEPIKPDHSFIVKINNRDYVYSR